MLLLSTEKINTISIISNNKRKNVFDMCNPVQCKQFERAVYSTAFCSYIYFVLTWKWSIRTRDLRLGHQPKYNHES